MATGGLFGVSVMLIFGVIGFIMNLFGYSVVVFIITFFLGKKFEQLLSQTLVIIDGNPLELINFPFSIILFVFALISFWWLGFRK
jgi:putative tricarboxylic transport membrane protein